MRSDDGFTIASLTLSDTYCLLMLGVTVEITGAAAYQCVAPRLLAPSWLRSHRRIGAGRGLALG